MVLSALGLGCAPDAAVGCLPRLARAALRMANCSSAAVSPAVVGAEPTLDWTPLLAAAVGSALELVGCLTTAVGGTVEVGFASAAMAVVAFGADTTVLLSSTGSLPTGHTTKLYLLADQQQMMLIKGGRATLIQRAKDIEWNLQSPQPMCSNIKISQSRAVACGRQWQEHTLNQ